MYTEIYIENDAPREGQLSVEGDVATNPMYSAINSAESSSGKRVDDGEKQAESVQFEPPVYRQRYDAVLALAKKFKSETVIDFGCAECKLVGQLKTILTLRKLFGVDIDKQLLVDHRNVAKAFLYEYMARPRSVELEVHLLAGCVSKKDSRLKGHFDLVSAVELIEHLPQHILQAFPETIFGFIRPKNVVITTPNGEFNKYFGMKEGTFRHWDHKFEWTRAQFRTWCSRVCQKYGYTVEYSGIGFLPHQSKEDREVTTGGCSQMGVFTRDESFQLTNPIPNDGECYESIIDQFFPFDERSQSVRIIDETKYVLGRLSRESELTAEMTGLPQKAIIPLEHFKDFPTLNKLIEGDLKLIEENFQNECKNEFPPVELLIQPDGSKALARWVYPYVSSGEEEDWPYEGDNSTNDSFNLQFTNQAFENSSENVPASINDVQLHGWER